MKKLTRILALLLALMMLAAGAPAETSEETAAEDAVLAVVNGENILQSDVDSYCYQLLYSLYQQGYDVTSLYDEIRQYAMNYAIESAVFYQKATELGLDQFTEEEEAALQTESETMLEEEVESWISSNVTLSESPTEEETAAARQSALEALAEEGYTTEALLEYNKQSMIYDRLYSEIAKDVVVTEEELKSAFDEQVESDKEQYADVSTYEYLTQYYGYTSYYTPEGYRGVTHILLEVDDTLMSTYQALQAELEEQQDDEEKTGEDAESVEDDTETVTQEQVDAAYDAIIASVQPTVDEIMAKLEAGTSFSDLIAEYGSDPGMTQEPYKTDGYSVHMDSIAYDPAFVKAAFSVDNIGEVSAPYAGTYGVYIVCYVRDVPAGAVEYTEEIKAELTETLLGEKENTLFTECISAWVEAAEITYTEAGTAYITPSEDETESSGTESMEDTDTDASADETTD